MCPSGSARAARRIATAAWSTCGSKPLAARSATWRTWAAPRPTAPPSSRGSSARRAHSNGARLGNPRALSLNPAMRCVAPPTVGRPDQLCWWTSPFFRHRLSNFVGPTSGTGGNAPKYQPLPSWWVAMLWKRLMGVSILSATVDALSASAEHVHAFAAELKGAGGDERNASRVVAFALVNWADAGTAPASLRVALPAGRKCTRGASFVLSSTNSTSTDAAVLALGIQLNGVPLKLAPGGALPASLEPHWTACDADGAVALTLEPLSAAFVVVE
eukprot:7385167-Prymnesium_polylepis.2